MSLIEVSSLSFSYGQQPVLCDLTFSVQQNDFLAVLGPNGAGKTTLINLLANLLSPKHGQIHIQTKPLPKYSRAELARVIAMVRQDTTTAFGFTVAQTVMMARYLTGGGNLFETRKDRDIVEQAMAMADVTRFAERPLNALSGGERQRVFIARALAQQTPILLLDEPTNHLDIKHQLAIFDLLSRLRRDEQKTIIIVSHDINLIQHYADSYLMLAADGRTLYTRDTHGLDPAAIESFFGVKGVQGTIANRKIFVPTGTA